MIIANKLRRPVEAWLFPKPIVTMAQTRNLCGDFYEDLTAIVGYANRIGTTGEADYCPDLQRSELVFYECKSVGCNGASIIYSARLEKDERFTRGEKGNRESRMLFYWFWRHNLPVKTMKDVPTLRRRLGESIQAAAVLPFYEVQRIARTRPERVLNKAYTGGGTELGYGNRSKGYGVGVSIPFPMLLAACDHKQTVRGVRADDREVPAFDVYMIGRFAYLLDAPAADDFQL